MRINSFNSAQSLRPAFGFIPHGGRPKPLKSSSDGSSNPPEFRTCDEMDKRTYNLNHEFLTSAQNRTIVKNQEILNNKLDKMLDNQREIDIQLRNLTGLISNAWSH